MGKLTQSARQQSCRVERPRVCVGANRRVICQAAFPQSSRQAATCKLLISGSCPCFLGFLSAGVGAAHRFCPGPPDGSPPSLSWSVSLPDPQPWLRALGQRCFPLGGLVQIAAGERCQAAVSDLLRIVSSHKQVGCLITLLHSASNELQCCAAMAPPRAEGICQPCALPYSCAPGTSWPLRKSKGRLLMR